jgi:2-C-methyl-D-erythritol 4-phosphate cytidylyltransferase
MQVDTVIVAAGSSTRFGETDKVLAELAGQPVIAWSVRAALDCPLVRRVIVVAGEANMDAVSEVVDEIDPDAVVLVGGPRRRDSVEIGLNAATTDYVAVHDGARPLVTADLFERCIDAAEDRAGAIVAVPVTDTIKRVEHALIPGSPQRSRLCAAQTPQVVDRAAWLLHAGLSPDDETDDAAKLARLDLDVAVVEGSTDNLKITHPNDLAVAAILLEQREPMRR